MPVQAKKILWSKFSVPKTAGAVAEGKLPAAWGDAQHGMAAPKQTRLEVSFMTEMDTALITKMEVDHPGQWGWWSKQRDDVEAHLQRPALVLPDLHKTTEIGSISEAPFTS